MRKKKKPEFNSKVMQREYFDLAVATYQKSESIRTAARELSISPMKLRKILITDGVYENEMSREIRSMYEKGMPIEEIARIEGMTASNVYAYLPYEKSIYNLEQKSVNADRQKRYRERQKTKTQVDEQLVEWLNKHPGIVILTRMEIQQIQHRVLLSSSVLIMRKVRHWMTCIMMQK